MLLVIVMVMLLVVSTLAGASLVNSMLERSLAKNQNYASVALQAAEAGVADGITWLNLNQGAIPDYTVTPNWTQTLGPRDLSLDLNGDLDTADPGEQLGVYSVTLRFKREWRDYNADGDCVDPGESSGYKDGDAQTPAANCPGDVVLFNKAAATADGGFGFTGSLYGTVNSGYPVVEIDAVGRYGNAGYREILFDVARNKLDAQVEGAFTARSGVTASGSSNVDGRNHLLGGGLDTSGSCGGDKPGVTVDAGVVLGCDLNADGDCGDPGESCGNAVGTPCWDTYDPTEHAGTPLQKTPWGVLGIDQTDFDGMFTKRTDATMDMPCSSDPYYIWYAGDQPTTGVRFNNSSGCNDYSGILVVHNENFDPDFWEASCPLGEASAGCAGKAPAVFDMNGNVSWTGIVIADQVIKVNGNPLIRGGIISLASGGVIETAITGNIDIEYSCEAVTGATSQGYKTRLGWHRIR
jgi:type II secretory pathway pseudopilin PulG